MFQDEARFGRISTPGRCWAPESIRPDVPVQMVREYAYVFAAVSPSDGELDSLILPEVNAEAMSVFLAEVSGRHPDECILMFLDRAGWHIAKNVRIPSTIRLLSLPPYSPELNPAEHLWDEIREKWFTNAVFKTMSAVEDTLVEAPVQLENDRLRVKGLTNFTWMVSS